MIRNFANHYLSLFRDVIVYKLLAKGTVKEYMLKCGEKKMQLGKDVIGNESIAGILTVSFPRFYIYVPIWKVYLEPSQTSTVGLFAKKLTGFTADNH